MGSEEQIILSNGVNREHTSLSCFVQKNTGWEVITSDEAEDAINVVVTINTDESELITDLVNALEEYYE